MRLATAVLLVCLFATPAAAVVRHVPAEHPTIQQALDSSSGGDVVLVSPGTYAENLMIGPAHNGVKLHSEAGPEQTIIDGTRARQVIACNGVGPETEIVGFTIMNGGRSPLFPGDFGGGLYITNASPRIEGNVIRDNIAVAGGGIFVDNGSPIIRDNEIRNNSALHGSGGGVYLEHQSLASIDHNVIRQNTCVSFGGGIFVAEFSHATIADNEIVANIGSLGGGGLWIHSGSHPQVVRNYIRQNQAPSADGGGIAIIESAQPQVTENRVESNSARRGAGIYIDAFLISVAPPLDEFQNGTSAIGHDSNLQSTMPEGAVPAGVASSPTISGNEIVDNMGSLGGGGLWITNGASPTISDNEISGNVGTPGGGGLWITQNSNPQVLRNRILANRAPSGVGGGIWINGGSQPKVLENRIESNTAQHGGGLEVEGLGSGVTTQINDNWIQNNHASPGFGGGARFSGASPAFLRNVVIQNRADDGGGGVALLQGSANVLRNTIVQNVAISGSGIYVSGNAHPTVWQNIVSHATSGNGIMVGDAGSSVALKCNDVWGNLPANYLGLPDPTGADGNISVDPQLCDLPLLDVHPSLASPCAPDNAPASCGLIGALFPACDGPVPALMTTWGRLKGSYR